MRSLTLTGEFARGGDVLFDVLDRVRLVENVDGDPSLLDLGHQILLEERDVRSEDEIRIEVDDGLDLRCDAVVATDVRLTVGLEESVYCPIGIPTTRSSIPTWNANWASPGYSVTIRSGSSSSVIVSPRASVRSSGNSHSRSASMPVTDSLVVSWPVSAIAPPTIAGAKSEQMRIAPPQL